jgi:DNA-binding transcriptional regulator GbsR (MarR family)
MTAASISPATAAFVEQIAVILEAEGLPRVCGRLFALLIVTPEPLSLDELADLLGVSKASVSINARTMEERGKIERVSRTGDRRDFYQIRDDIVEKAIEDRSAKLRRIQQAFEGARADKLSKDPVVSRRLEAILSAHQLMIDANTTALEEWRAKHRKASAPRSR